MINNFLKSIDDLIYEIISVYYLNRKKTKSKIEDISKPIIRHLIKLLKWEDPINYNKHIKDLNNWFIDAQDYKINQKRISIEDYKDWLFYEYFPDDFNEFEELINSAYFDEYRQNLKEICSDREVYDKIENIIKPICKDLSAYKFRTIEAYL